MPETIMRELEAIMRAVFQDPALMVTEALTMDQVPAWDSVGHMALISATENRFAIRCDLAELVQVESVAALAALVERKWDGRTLQQP
ncbi:MAG: acyl carrier protein [Magnetococcales bacterium]|nr:acyl carrier protein [Magnetococcales bacterium]